MNWGTNIYKYKYILFIYIYMAYRKQQNDRSQVIIV